MGLRSAVEEPYPIVRSFVILPANVHTANSMHDFFHRSVFGRAQFKYTLLVLTPPPGHRSARADGFLLSPLSA